MNRHHTVFLVIVSCTLLALAWWVFRERSGPPLSTVENVRTFAKLYGYVRFFHPSDEAAAIDWDRFAVHGVRQVRGAGDADELREALEELFHPIAPTVQIYETADGAPEPSASLMPDDASEMELVAWQHLGVDLGANDAHRSVRLNRTMVQPPPTEGSVGQKIDARPFRGRPMRMTGAVRTEVSGEGNQAHLFLYVELPNYKLGFADYMQDRPITAGDWQVYEITGTVDEEADSIGVSAWLAGVGSAWFDDFTLQMRMENGWIDVPLNNAAFEVGAPTGWFRYGDDYKFSVVTEEPYEGEHALAVEFADGLLPADPLFEERAEAGEVVERELGGGLSAQIPLALFSAGGQTLRPDGAPSPDALAASLQDVSLTDLTAADEALRMADVITTWNVLQHFYPYFDVVDVDWDAALTAALEDAMDDADGHDFLRTLQTLVARIEDGHGFISHPITWEYAWLPVFPQVVEGQVVALSTVSFSPFEVGDVIVSVEGVPAVDLVTEQMELYSGSDQWQRHMALSKFAWGRHGEDVSVTVLRDGGELEMTVPRSFTGRPEVDRPDNITKIDPGIFYVDLSRTSRDELSARIDEISAADGVIVDLRARPNATMRKYLTDRPLRSPTWDAPKVIYPDREHMTFDTTNFWVTGPQEPRITGTVVFLADERALSATETALQFVEHYKLGEIVGRPTAGANGAYNRITLPSGATVNFTGRRVLKHDGSTFHGVGIQPTIPLERTLAAVREGRDEYIEKAIEVIRSGSRE